MAIFTAAAALSLGSSALHPYGKNPFLPLQRQIARALQLPVELSMWMPFNFNPLKRFCWTSS